MSWTRLDDGYDGHGKLLALGDGQRGDARRWVWTRILLYTNRHGAADIPDGIHEAIPRASRAFIDDCVTVGLADRLEDGRIVVHDWPLYADVTVEVKVAYALERMPEASANEIARHIAGKRQLVLHEISRQRGSQEPATHGSQEPPNQFPPPVPENHRSGSQSGSRARAPVPTRPNEQDQEPQPAPAEPTQARPRDPVWDFVTSIEGEPLTRYRTARGRIVADLRALLNGHGPDELHRRHEALAREWGDAKATARALVQHWERAGRIADGTMRPAVPATTNFSADALYQRALDSERTTEEVRELDP